MTIKERASSKIRAVAPEPAIRHAGDFLQTAYETIKARGVERDTNGTNTLTEAPAERSMASAVKAFNALEGTTLSERQGWMFMAVLKMARARAAVVNGRANPDDYVDGPAYFALAGESIGFDAIPSK